ncbi:S1 RNA-binding domain-containing protein [Peptoniphilus sp. KCTC 25270]|uniref:S1 RNA-binding domain-containing protein n=1 Tax=Peptoniphilus sp. KCTC 25270 TaxID=2897414 RepID=UPI001E50AEC5|nr:S1 RNA-binding domain-containing protein [Peptoniphilus sp. KCTC 25270]MCD1146822.1 S1 RNA-binding domain-containing protein [Peptoniphilus sp. KCTC 25270]
MELEVGKIVDGVVTGLAKFGAFVQIDENTSGLVHISEVSNDYIKEVSDVLKKGDKVKVKVLSIDPSGKIGLSIKQTEEKKKSEYKKSVPQAVTLSKVVHKTENTSFDEMLSKFMKDSNEKIESAKQRKNVRQGKTKR